MTKGNEHEKELNSEKAKEKESSELTQGQDFSKSEDLGQLRVNLERAQKDLQKLDEGKKPEEETDDKKDEAEKTELNQKIAELERQIKEIESELKILQDPKNPSASNPQHQKKIEETQDKLFSLTQDKAKSYLQKVEGEGRLVNNEDGSQTIKCYDDEQYNEGYYELTSAYDRLGLKYEISEGMNKDNIMTTTIAVLIPKKFWDKEPFDLTPSELREIHEAYKAKKKDGKDDRDSGEENDGEENEGGEKRKGDNEEEESEYAKEKREEREEKKQKKREEKAQTRREQDTAKDGAASDRAKSEIQDAIDAAVAKKKDDTAPASSWASYVRDPKRQTQSAAPPSHLPGRKPH